MRHSLTALKNERIALYVKSIGNTGQYAQEINTILEITRKIHYHDFSESKSENLLNKIAATTQRIATLTGSKNETTLEAYRLLKKYLEYQADYSEIKNKEAQKNAALAVARAEKRLNAEKKENAAITIQNEYRRHQASKQVNALRDSKEKATVEAKARESATVIQSLFRMNQAIVMRKKLATASVSVEATPAVPVTVTTTTGSRAPTDKKTADEKKATDFLQKIHDGICALRREYTSEKHNGSARKAGEIFDSNLSAVNTADCKAMGDALARIVTTLRSRADSSFFSGASSKTLGSAEKLAAELGVMLPAKPEKTGFFSRQKKSDAVGATTAGNGFALE